MYTVRFQFLDIRADEFLPDGQVVTEQEYDSIEEIVAYVQEFSSALDNVLVYCQETGKIVDLADFVI